jgi:hypothetical protein
VRRELESERIFPSPAVAWLGVVTRARVRWAVLDGFFTPFGKFGSVLQVPLLVSGKPGKGHHHLRPEQVSDFGTK